MERPVESNGDENAPPNSTARPPQVQYIFKKNKAPVNIPQSLSLENYGVKAQDSQKEVGLPGDDYNLRAIVYHIGRRASSGHYTANCVRKCKKEVHDENGVATTIEGEWMDSWVTFDDTNSAKVSWERVASQRNQENAYLLLYQLRE